MSTRREILESPRLSRLVLSLAWPVIASMGMRSLFTIVDLLWVGRLGPEAVAAVSTGIFASWALLAIGASVALGALSWVSREVGAGRTEDAGRTAAQAILWAGAIGLGVAAAGQPLSALLYSVIVEDPQVRTQGTVYLQLLCAFAPVWYVNTVFEDVFRAVGDTRTPFRVLAVTLVFNIVLDPLLILGPGPLPRLGTAGAGLVTGLAQVLGVFLYAAASRGENEPVPFRAVLRATRLRLGELGRLIRVGLPISSISVMYSAVYVVIGRIAGEFGTGALAALGIVNRVESIAFLTVHGLGIATATLVGQNLGAGRADRAELLAGRANRLGMAAGAAATVAFVFLPRPLVGVFTDDPETLRLGVDFLRIVGYCQILQAWELVLEGAFSGSGHTLPAMLISVPVSVLRIPVAWGLAVGAGLGPAAIWWTISVSAALRGAAVLFWWSRGTWKTGHLPPSVPPPPAEGGSPAPASGAPADNSDWMVPSQEE